MAHTIIHVNGDRGPNETGGQKAIYGKSLQPSAFPQQGAMTKPTVRSLRGTKSQEKSKGRPGIVARRQKTHYLLAMSVTLIVIVFAALIFLLYNQSKVISVTAQNAAIQRQINRLTKENAERRESISKNTDLESVERQALRLGLQSPLRSQIIEVKQSQKDEIIVNLRSANAQGVKSQRDEEIETIFANVEGFFKQIR